MLLLWRSLTLLRLRLALLWGCLMLLLWGCLALLGLGCSPMLRLLRV